VTRTARRARVCQPSTDADLTMKHRGRGFRKYSFFFSKGRYAAL
jgi:hypothetical protein